MQIVREGCLCDETIVIREGNNVVSCSCVLFWWLFLLIPVVSWVFYISLPERAFRSPSMACRILWRLNNWIIRLCFVLVFLLCSSGSLLLDSKLLLLDIFKLQVFNMRLEVNLAAKTRALYFKFASWAQRWVPSWRRLVHISFLGVRNCGTSPSTSIIGDGLIL